MQNRHFFFFNLCCSDANSFWFIDFKKQPDVCSFSSLLTGSPVWPVVVTGTYCLSTFPWLGWRACVSEWGMESSSIRRILQDVHPLVRPRVCGFTLSLQLGCNCMCVDTWAVRNANNRPPHPVLLPGCLRKCGMKCHALWQQQVEVFNYRPNTGAEAWRSWSGSVCVREHWAMVALFTRGRYDTTPVAFRYGVFTQIQRIQNLPNGATENSSVL